MKVNAKRSLPYLLLGSLLYVIQIMLAPMHETIALILFFLCVVLLCIGILLLSFTKPDKV